MKEQTYGWYPSAKNVYEERRLGALTPYQIEALYKFRNSKYYQPPITPPEQKSSPSRATPFKRADSASVRATSRSSKDSIKQDRNEPDKLQPRVRSAPIVTRYKPPPKLIIPTPQQCWSTHVPETEVTTYPLELPTEPPSGGMPATLPTTSPNVQVPDDKPAVDADPNSRDNIYQKIVRIKSATVRRDTSSRPSRPVKSAGPVRPTPTPTPELHSSAHSQSPASVQDMIEEARASKTPYSVQMTSPSQPRPASLRPTASPTQKPPSGKKTPLRPKAPSPYKMELHLNADEEEERPETPDYNEMTRKHGWMMEVHGDPLKLKKVSRRLPYYVTVDEPETERDPPNVHMENIETFFLNTIPRRPLAFTIHKEWISEIIHKKRLEMQKKHGINHRFKNFSFVY